MFQLDDNFLKDVGLESLPEEQKKAFLQHIFDQLELNVGTRLSEGLSEAQMQEFEAFIDQNEQKVRAWFAEHMPTFHESEEYKSFRTSAPAEVSDVAVMSEYGSLKWLELNRPDYRQVVALEIENLKKEITENKDAILGVQT